MTDSLESSRYSVEHAKRRIRELDTEILAFGQTNPYIQVVEHDADTGEQVYKIKLIKPLPVSLKGIAFDAIINLRAALDNAGYSIAIAAGTRGKDGHYPFGGNYNDAQSCIKRRSKDIPREIFDVMLASKPYKGGNDLLWALNKLSNTRKHEIIIPMVAASGPFEITVGGGSGHNIFRATGPVSLGGRTWNRTKNELEYMRFGHGSQVDIDANFSFTFFIAFSKVDVVDGQPAIGVLDAMTGEVERILMAIEDEAKRIGIFE